MPFLAARESKLSSFFLITLYLEVLCHTCAPIFLAHITHFLKARRLKESGSRLTTGFHSHVRILLKVSHANICWAIMNHTFSSHTTSSSSHFLGWHKPPLSQRSTAWAKNPHKRFPILWIKVDWSLSYDNFWTISHVLFTLDYVLVGSLHFAQCNSVGLPCYKILCSGFLEVCAHDITSEWSIPAETLEGFFAGLLRHVK